MNLLRRLLHDAPRAALARAAGLVRRVPRKRLALIAGVPLAVAAAGVGVAVCVNESPDASAAHGPGQAAAGAKSASNAPAAAAPTPAVFSKWPELPLKTDGPHLYSKTRYLYVYPEPSTRSKWIGYLWVGGSTKLKSATPVAGKGGRKASGCNGSFYEVEPKGFVCVENDWATLDPNDAAYTMLRKHAADYNSPWPYWYGESKGETRLPELEGLTTPKWAPGLQELKIVNLPARSTVAWTEEVAAKNGLPYLWLSDSTFLHKDSVVPYPRTEFKGVHLGGDVQLPLAFFRRIPRPKMKRDGDHFSETGESWPRLSWVKLTGKSEKNGKSTYWETAENGLWLEEHDTAVIKSKYDSTPWKSPIKSTSSGQVHDGEGRRTWVEVAAQHGWMIAYEDDEPVFATMISGGKLGAATPKADGQSPATTPLGRYHVDAKYVTTNLKAELNDGTDFIHSEVPWSQHFYTKFLLHTAYWHDNWGEGRSGGCVNMSPIDAKWLFDWTQPKVPEGWHAYKTMSANRAGKANKNKSDSDEPATMVLIHQ